MTDRGLRLSRWPKRLAMVGLFAALVLRPRHSVATGICSASAFSCPAAGTCTITGTWNVGSDCILDFGGQAVELRGTLQADVLGGSFNIAAGSLRLFGGKIKSLGNTYSSGGNIGINVSGLFSITGTGPRIDTSGNGGGGSIVVQAGSIAIDGGVVAADGGLGGYCGNGGAIDLESPGGPLTFSTTIHTNTPGGDCVGGDITLVGAPVTISGQLDARTGGAAAREANDAIFIESTVGDLVLTSGAWLRADGLGQPDGVGSPGGAIELTADSGNISVAGTVSSTGKSPGGDGGAFFADATGDIAMNAAITLSGGGSAIGGLVDVDADGSVSITGNVDATGSVSADGVGGDIGIGAGGDILITSALDTSATYGGTITTSSSGTTTLSGRLLAKATQGSGGDISVQSCSITASNTIDASATLGGFPGAIDLYGGSIAVGATAVIKALTCSTGSCITFDAPASAVSINSAATVSPTAVITVTEAPSECST